MQPKKSISRRNLAILSLLVFAVILRAFELGNVPAPLATADEYHYAWAGLSLLTEGRPTAWSYLGGYNNTPAHLGKVKLIGSSFPIVSPALDHPPLYSVIAGGWAWLMGARPMPLTTDTGHRVTIWQIDLARCRILSLILFAVSFLLLYDLAARRCGWFVAVVTLLIYSSVNHMALQSRLLVTETFTTPLLLGGLCAWERYRLGRWSERRFAIVTIVLIVAATLSKLVAVSQAAVIMFLLLMEGRRRAVIYPLLGVVMGAALYLAYGAWQGWDIFMKALDSQSARFHGFGMLPEVIRTQLLVHDDTRLSYPLMLGWIALFIIAVGRKGTRGRTLIAAAVAYLLAFGFFVAMPSIFGWHIIPFFPFHALAIAMIFAEAYRRPGPIINAAAIALFLPMALESIYAEHAGWLKAMRYAYLGIVAVVFGLPLLPKYGNTIQRLLLIAALSCLLIHEFWLVFFYGSVGLHTLS
ncbi:glycosyltransferase family 39 protein [bacterium]|nr:glycosyltransferase family 39 protein [bacterium]